MTTEIKAGANRANALKSTGPKSSKGKARSSKNALKHGLLSREVLLKGDNEAALVDLGRRMRLELDPQGPLEELLVDRIVSLAWRLRRAQQIEVDCMEIRRAKISDWALQFPQPEHKAEARHLAGGAFMHHGDAGKTFLAVSRYEAGIERGMYRALHELQRLQAERAGKPVLPPVVVDVDVAVAPSTGEEE